MNGVTHNKFSVAFGYIGLVLLDYFKIIQINFFIAMPIMILVSQTAAKMVDYDLDWHNIKNKTALTYVINKVIHATGGKHRCWQTHSLDINLWFIGLWILVMTRYKDVVLSNSLIKLSRSDIDVLNLLMFSVWFGWLSHLFADSLNGTGIRLLFFTKGGHALVPNKVRRRTIVTLCALSYLTVIVVMAVQYFTNSKNLKSLLRLSRIQIYIIVISIAIGTLLITLAKAIKGKEMRFKTGEEWEAFIQGIMRKLNILLGIGAVAYGIMKLIN